MFIPLVTKGVLTAASAEQVVGTINPRQAIAWQEAYINAFFTQFLKKQPEPILDNPSPGSLN